MQQEGEHRSSSDEPDSIISSAQSCRCRICGRGFVDFETLSQHEAKDHHAKEYEKCPVPSCEYHSTGFKTWRECAHHALHHYKASIICGYCGDGTQTFRRADQFVLHLMDGHDPFMSFDNSIKTKCPVCRTVTLSAWDLSIHLTSCVMKELKQLSSESSAPKRSASTFKAAQSPASHTVGDIDSRSGKVEANDTLYQSGTSRRKHAATWQCHICPKSFTRALALRAHVNNHKGERPFKCSVCELSFTRNNDRKTHQAIHSGERRFACATCGRPFSRAANLKRHERGHARQADSDALASSSGDTPKMSTVTDSQQAALVLTEIAGLEMTLGTGFDATDYLDLDPLVDDDLHEIPWPGGDWDLPS